MSPVPVPLPGQIPRRGFTLLELLLALGVAGLAIAALAPALVGVLRAERRAREAVEPLAESQAALAVLREDLWSAPRPDQVGWPAFVVDGGSLTCTSRGGLAIHDRVGTTSPGTGEALVAWGVEGGRLVRWRSAQLLAVDATPGTLPPPAGTPLMDDVAAVQFAVWWDNDWNGSWSSDEHGAILPRALRLTVQRTSGTTQVWVLDLLQVELDPDQAAGGT